MLLFCLSLGLLHGTYISSIITKTPFVALLYNIRATCPATHILIYFIILIIFGEK